jgi:hypothetical protein
MDSWGSEQGPMVGSTEHSNVFLNSTKSGEFLDQSSVY